MRLRDHSARVYRGHSTLPPVWIAGTDAACQRVYEVSRDCRGIENIGSFEIPWPV
jgi:hypothetical protein